MTRPATEGQPEWMPTPIEVLTAIGDSLVNAGCILSYALPTDTSLTVLVKQNVTLTINCHYDPNPNVLTFTSGVCVGLQIDLRDSLRPLARLVDGKAVVEPGVAVQMVLDYFRNHLGCW